MDCWCYGTVSSILLFEHWFGCRAAEPGFAGDIGAIEIWLIDWLIDERDFVLNPAGSQSSNTL